MLQRTQDTTATINVHSNIIKRRRREILKRGLRYAEVSGNCCWEVRERFSGGYFQALKSVANHFLPWDVRSVRLTKC